MAKKAKLSWLKKRQLKKQQAQKRNKAKAEKGQKELRDRVSERNNYEIVQADDRLEKMSEILENFIDPYLDMLETEDQHHRLLMVAIVAWNAALLPLEDQKATIDKFAQGLPGDDETQEDFYAIVAELISRKTEYFAQYKRMILDYELTDTGDGYHLSVVSTQNALD